MRWSRSRWRESPGAYSEAGLVEQPSAGAARPSWAGRSSTPSSETFGPAGTLGRDSMHDVVLVHRLRDALRFAEPATCPTTSARRRSQAITKDRSVMDRVRANREVHDLLRDGYRAEWPDDRGDKRSTPRSATSTSATRPKNDWLAASQVWVAGELHRRRTDVVLFVNGIPLVLAEFKEPNRPVKAAYDENLTDYRDTIPQLFVPNGFVILLQRLGGQGRLDLRAVGVLRRLEGHRRRRHPGRRRAGDRDPGHLRPRPAARPRRELRRLHRAARRADQGRGPQPPVPRRQRRDREPAPGPRRRATSGSACSGTPRGPARACRCCGSPRRCCARSRARGRS